MVATRIDCDIHPAVGGTRTTLLPYLDDHWKEQVVSRAIDGLDLTELSAEHAAVGPRRLAPGAGQAGQRTSDGATRRVRPARRQPCDLQRAVRRPGGVRPLYGGGILQGDQRLDRDGMAGARCAAARLDHDSAAGAGPRGRGNRAPRRRPALRLGAGTGAGREPARPTALLAGLAGGRKTLTAGGDPCRQPISGRAELDRLAVLSL